MTKPEAIACMVDACTLARPCLVNGIWMMDAVAFDRLCAAIDAFHHATNGVDPRTWPALELLRALDRRGGLGHDVHEQIQAVVGKEVGLGR